MKKDRGKQAQRMTLMLDTPIPKLIPKMALPTIAAMLIGSVYSLTNTYFVSFLGTAATAAIGVSAAIDHTILMAGSFLAVGSNSYIARLLGERQPDKASRVLSTAFFSALITGVLVMVPGLFFIEQIVRIFGATQSVIPYAVDYANYILMSAPLVTASFVLNQCLRSEGSPVYAMVGMGAGGLLNIALTPLFIFTLGLGIKGAAIATLLSKAVGFCILIYPYVSKSSILRLSIKSVGLTGDIVREITLMGLPSLLRMGLSVIAGILINNAAGRHSDSALAAMSLVSRIMMLPTAAILGFGQGYMPVSGYNWGAKNYERVRQAFKFSSIVAVGGTLVVSILIAVFSKNIISLFTEADAEMVWIGSFSLIAQSIVMPINAWVIIVNMFYASLGKPVGAIILGSTRQGICFLPLVFILPALFGIKGIACVQAGADLLTLLIVIPFAVSIIKDVSRRSNNELQMPKSRS